MPQSANPKIGIVAGEKSGDALGAGLIAQLKQLLPGAEFAGLGGPSMTDQGFHSIADMERLSVMGFIEPLKRLPDLLALRKQLYHHFIHWRADVVVGIDSPDFNLGLERKLRRQGIRCCHYVCPSVWAWRQGRVKTIRRSVDCVLALLPFEQAFLQAHGVAASFVGHPLADRIATSASSAVRTDSDSMTLCVMPGSRQSEVDLMVEPLLQAAHRLQQTFPSLHVVVPAASPALYQRISEIAAAMQFNPQRFTLHSCNVQQESLAVMEQADVILLTSGTATLEAAMLGKPMVVAYKMNPLGYALAKRLVNVEHIALPNLLAGYRLVPEWVQGEVTADVLHNSVQALLSDPVERERISRALLALRDDLARDADVQAARAVAGLLSA